jgi:hypothetical protein
VAATARGRHLLPGAPGRQIERAVDQHGAGMSPRFAMVAASRAPCIGDSGMPEMAAVRAN